MRVEEEVARHSLATGLMILNIRPSPFLSHQLQFVRGTALVFEARNHGGNIRPLLRAGGHRSDLSVQSLHIGCAVGIGLSNDGSV